MLFSNIGTVNPWKKTPRLQISEKRLLVIGTGRIGARVSELMKHFMNVTTFDILTNNMSELKPFIQQADCVSIHIPKSDENISFIDAVKLSWMKNGSILINTARGAIVDEDALYVELQNGRLKAAFDVYWQEPYEGKLTEFHSDLFFMTPHIASTCSGFLNGCRNDLNNLVISLKNKLK